MMELHTQKPTDTRSLRAFLGKCRVFQGLNEIELATLVGLSHLQSFDEGDLIIKQGSAGDAYYIIYDGVVEVSKLDRGGQGHAVATLEPTDVFGEIALAQKRPRTANVTVTEDTTLLRFAFQDFEKVQQLAPEMAKKILDNMRKIMTERNWAM